MTLIFGKLTASFVEFGNVVLQLLDNPGDPALLARLVTAQRTLKSEAARDSLYLVIIGIAMFVATYGYMGIWVYTGEG
jgi:ATP-binding cassette subfamily B (MDR/TAP) protein 1